MRTAAGAGVPGPTAGRRTTAHRAGASRAALLPILCVTGLLAACGGRAVPDGAASPNAQEVVLPTYDRDPYRWLESVEGERALDWVRAENEETARALASTPLFDTLYADVLEALNAPSRIPDVTWRGGWLYELRRDAEHPRGVYRRTTLERLRDPDPEWETVLDVDSLSAAEGERWVFGGMECLPPEYRRCLVSLAPGGTDAAEVRELDARTLEFVEGGFRLPVAKGGLSWRDADHVYVATDFGPGSMTTSGYPRVVKLWERGTPLDQARTLHRGDRASVSVQARRVRTDSGDIDLVSESTSFWSTTYHQLVDGRPVRLELPASAEVVDGWRGRLVVVLNEAWERGPTTYPQGSVVLADPAALREGRPGGAAAAPGSDGGAVERPGGAGTGGAGSADSDGIDLLFQPADGEVLVESGATATEQGVLLNVLDNVRGRLYLYRPPEGGGEGSRTLVPFPDNGQIAVATVNEDTGDFFARYESFTTPPTLYHVPAATLEPEAVKAQEPTFDASGIEVTQHFATSADGTRVPWFMVAPEDAELDGTNPTHIFSYGGFRNSLVPAYSGTYEDLKGAYGPAWLERGGVFVLANIRGGGEFGPAWHEAALLENRPRAYEDFEAVAEDLIRRGVTSPERLGIEGRSNGGLLVLATMARRPDLYGAVVAGSTLSDMRRYHELLAGASWMAEYGDPDDPAEWAFIREYSPYHNIELHVDYPPVFFYTSTRDDRVHPGHARKTAALLEALGNPVRYYENIEGGHGGSATNEQLAYRVALSFAHLWEELGGR